MHALVEELAMSQDAWDGEHVLPPTNVKPQVLCLLCVDFGFLIHSVNVGSEVCVCVCVL